MVWCCGPFDALTSEEMCNTVTKGNGQLNPLVNSNIKSITAQAPLEIGSRDDLVSGKLYFLPQLIQTKTVKSIHKTK